MSNPWQYQPAFDFFFCDEVEISCARNNQISSLSANVCLFPIEDEDTMTDVEVDSNVKCYSFLLKKSDWTLGTKLQYGDIANVNSTTTYVQSVDDEQDWYRIKVRTKK